MGKISVMSTGGLLVFEWEPEINKIVERLTFELFRHFFEFNLNLGEPVVGTVGFLEGCSVVYFIAVVHD